MGSATVRLGKFSPWLADLEKGTTYEITAGGFGSPIPDMR